MSTKVFDIGDIQLKEIYEFIAAYFPWKSEKELIAYVVHETPYPFIYKLEDMKVFIKTHVVHHWEEYVIEADYHGYDVDEKPGGKFLNAVDYFWLTRMKVPSTYKT